MRENQNDPVAPSAIVSPPPEEAPLIAIPAAPHAYGDPSSIRSILMLAVPLTLSTTGHTLMQVLDGLFLANYSEDAIAAIGPAGMMAFTLQSLFLGAAGYTSTFVAQYKGAGRQERVGAAVWQGIYFSLIASAVVIAISFTAPGIFAWAGHEPRLRPLEEDFFKICCWFAPFSIIGSAVAGFFTGLGKVRSLMVAQIGGQILNALLAWLLIFGYGPVPELGVAGAALASGIAQTVVTLSLVIMFLQRNNRRGFMTWSGRQLDAELFGRLLRFGFPNGVRFFIEMLGWTLFIVFIGRIGERELAATNIAWRINLLAFMPMIGIGIAVSTLVGQAQGMKRPDLSVKVAWRGLAVAQTWMMAGALLFVLCPELLVGLFTDGPKGVLTFLKSGDALAAGSLGAMVVVLLRYVAVYCLLDAFNIIFSSVLQGAGDTQFMLGLNLAMYSVFVCVLAILDAFKMGLHAEWCAATGFVMLLALAFYLRFVWGKWKSLQVIEPDETVGV